MSGPRMVPILRSEREDFVRMAIRHFSELNPAFVPGDDWKRSFFENILANPESSLRWIMVDQERAGFILFGLEKHRFLPRKTGVVYELHVAPGFRRRGIARSCALEAIRELWTFGPSKIQLEVVEGNMGAAALWKSLGFQKVTERFVLTSGAP
jgi:ribosomal protein S18 acetylase RimI-like enzyme